MTTGFVERIKGKAVLSKDSIQQFGTGTAAFKGGGNIYINSSSAGLGNTSDTSVDTLDSYALPGNSLYGNNYMLTIQAFGQFAATASTSKIAKLSFGSESISLTQGSTASAVPWMLSLQVMKMASNQQFITGQTIQGTTHGGIPAGVQLVSAAESDAAAITIKVTGQTNTAAANDVVLYGWFVEANNF